MNKTIFNEGNILIIWGVLKMGNPQVTLVVSVFSHGYRMIWGYSHDKTDTSSMSTYVYVQYIPWYVLILPILYPHWVIPIPWKKKHTFFQHLLEGTAANQGGDRREGSPQARSGPRCLGDFTSKKQVWSSKTLGEIDWGIPSEKHTENYWKWPSK